MLNKIICLNAIPIHVHYFIDLCENDIDLYCYEMARVSGPALVDHAVGALPDLAELFIALHKPGRCSRHLEIKGLAEN